MKLQFLLFTVTILTAIKSYPRVLANLISSLSSATSTLANSQSSASWARLQVLGRVPTNITDNNKKETTPAPVPTDQDRAQDLQGLVIVMVILLVFAILTIVVGEVLAWRHKGENQSPAEDNEGRVVYED